MLKSGSSWADNVTAHPPVAPGRAGPSSAAVCSEAPCPWCSHSGHICEEAVKGDTGSFCKDRCLRITVCLGYHMSGGRKEILVYPLSLCEENSWNSERCFAPGIKQWLSGQECAGSQASVLTSLPLAHCSPELSWLEGCSCGREVAVYK